MMMEDKKTRILFLIPTLTGGGSERVIITLLRHLDRRRFELSIAVVDMRNSVYREDIPDDVKFIDLKCSRVRYSLPKIISLIWLNKPDIVLSTLGHLNLALAILRNLLPNRVRYIARESSIVSKTIRGYSSPWLWKWAYRRFYKCFDMVVCQSKHMQSDLVDNHYVPPEKTIIIHNPVDVDQINKMASEDIDIGVQPVISNDNSTAINFVAAGRLVPVKGFDILIESLALCNNPNLYLTILGEGPMLKTLELLTESKGLKDKIRFAGFQKNPYAFFIKADALILSSHYEGFPNVLLEALACNTPIISTPELGEASNIVRGLHGCEVADATDSFELAQAINRWIKQGKQHFSGSSAITPFTIQNTVKLYEKTFGTALNDPA
ncbi:MAG: glycosyltransferase [Steroidobacteraceae bacterium]